MFNTLSNKECFLRIFLVISVVTAVVAEPMAFSLQNTQSQPFLLIERMKPAPRPCLENQANTNRTGLYVMWQKLLVRVTSQWQQSVLAKSFGVEKVANEQEMAPYNIERGNFGNMAAEVAMERRIVNAVLTLTQLLLALDIVILAVVFAMLISSFCTTKKPTEEEVVKA
ncbi:uncharacterized protein LOC126762747 [Bactrocera neohumeralis]|uniref:uncharacterized protein LOC126762747 n=1 Tax=Bactrocera neohumeralis TaxID=98809 RepID=UPI0021652533|nr:uncharacterized protein LOC126762747 [Bactrocera neohumeralis]